MEQKISIGIAGAGLMGETHAQNYLKIKDIELYALSEKNNIKQNIFKDRFSPLIVYDDVYKMIEDDNIDLIDICLPTPMHAKIAIAALAKNKHVLLEKPIALNLDDALLIKKAAENSSGKFMVAHVLRFWPEYKSMRKIINTSMIDETICGIYASRYNELPLWSEDTWIMDEKLSGGLIIDLIIHDIDYIIWNFGKADKVFCHGIFNDKNFAIQVMAVLKLKNGAVAYIDGGYLNPTGSGLTSQMRLYSNNSSLEMFSNKNTIKLSQKKELTKEVDVYGNDGYLEELSYFIDCIKQKKEPVIITIDDAIESLKTCLAIKESLKTEQWINVE